MLCLYIKTFTNLYHTLFIITSSVIVNIEHFSGKIEKLIPENSFFFKNLYLMKGPSDF